VIVGSASWRLDLLACFYGESVRCISVDRRQGARHGGHCFAVYVHAGPLRGVDRWLLCDTAVTDLASFTAVFLSGLCSS